MAHNHWGQALADQRDYAGAIAHYRKALDLDPKNALAHGNWGVALAEQQDYAAAIEYFRQALDLDPGFASAHRNWGVALARQQDYTGAIAHYHKALDLDPSDAMAHTSWGNALYAQQEYAGAIAHYRQALDLDPRDAKAHGAMGRALLGSGDFGQAHKATRRALELLPTGHPLRSHVQNQLKDCDQMLQLEDRVKLILQGQAQPTGAAEQLQLAQFCRAYRRYAAAARLYAAVLAVQPAVANDIAGGDRYQAACATALAAAGEGKDADKLSAEDKAKLRRQALDWLRADLEAYRKKLLPAPATGQQKPLTPLEQLLAKQSASGGPVEIVMVADRLARWQTDPDLAGVREEKALTALPAQEQNDWRRLWTDVGRLLKQARSYFTETRLQGTLIGQKRQQVHEVILTAGKTYVFDLESTAFDAVLRLEDELGKKLAENNDIEPGVILNSRIVFTAAKDGRYRLAATSFQGQGTGAYSLVIREFFDKK
jgi:Flp pilus assembly protein TadD